MERKIFVFAGITAAAIIALVYGGFRPGETSAQSEAAVQWEYALLGSAYLPFTGENTDAIVVAEVNICYPQAPGYRNEQVRGEVIVSRYLQENRLEGSAADPRRLMSNRAAENAISRAVTKLGLEGYELVSGTAPKLDRYVVTSRGSSQVMVGSYDTNADLVFKRPRR